MRSSMFGFAKFIAAVVLPTALITAATALLSLFHRPEAMTEME